MAKQKSESNAPTIKNIDEFIDVWKRQRTGSKSLMQERTLVALRLKLSELFRTGIIHPKELFLYTEILQRDRLQGRLSHHYESDLAAIEAEKCELHCEVKHESLEPVLRWPKGTRGKYRIDDRGDYHVYTQETIPGTHRWSLELARKNDQGRPIADNEYPTDITRWRHKQLKEKFFHAWFDIVDESVLDSPIGNDIKAPTSIQLEL